MTADEALEIVESALDYQPLNKVQELVFRHSWEGRSYKEIAVSSEYEYDYIKDVGAKLWKLLSEAFGEKVKKDNLKPVLKRYLRQNQVNLYRNQAIQFNLSGANFSGANLCVTKICKNLIEANLCHANSKERGIPDDNTESFENGDNQKNPSKPKEQIYYWHNLPLRSPEQVKIAEALDRINVLFFPNTKVRLTSSEGKENKQADFLIFYRGKSGILVIENALSEQDEGNFRECDRIFQSHGISIIQYYHPTRCSQEPDRVVQEFLELLSQVEA